MTRQQFYDLHRIARREGIGGKELWEACLRATNCVGDSFPIRAMALHKAVESAIKPPANMQQELRRNVLNHFGTKNPWRGGQRSGAAYRIARRTDDLRAKLRQQGRLEVEAGNWATGRILPKPSHRLQNTSPEETKTLLYAKHGKLVA